MLTKLSTTLKGLFKSSIWNEECRWKQWLGHFGPVLTLFWLADWFLLWYLARKILPLVGRCVSWRPHTTSDAFRWLSSDHLSTPTGYTILQKQSQVCLSKHVNRQWEHKRAQNMSSKNPAELSGKSLLEVLARMLVEHPCRHVLFCQADASEHLGTMGLGLCTALWTCSAVHKINTLYNFSIALCIIYGSSKSWRKDIFNYGFQDRTEYLAPFLCQLMQMKGYLNSPSTKRAHFAICTR